jgi:hypothetical protein
MSHQKLQLPFHTTGLNFYGGIFFISNCEVVTNKQGDMMYASAKLNLCKEKSSHQNARYTLFFLRKAVPHLWSPYVTYLEAPWLSLFLANQSTILA